MGFGCVLWAKHLLSLATSAPEEPAQHSHRGVPFHRPRRILPLSWTTLEKNHRARLVRSSEVWREAFFCVLLSKGTAA